MLRVIGVEFLKLRRANAVWGTMAVVLAFALMTGWMTETWDPGIRFTWDWVLEMGAMYMAGWWGILIFSLAAAHVFGGEFADGTATGMLTTPVRRETFVLAKFIVLAAWVVVLSLFSVACHAGVAVIRGADGFSWSLVLGSLQATLKITVLLYMTLPTVAFISILGRGYLAPMMFSTAMMTVSWGCGFLGWTRWFPWAMPAAVGGGLGPPDLLRQELGAGSWAISLALFVVGLLAVFVYMNRADTAGQAG